ncbi:MAG: hypothetical protein C0401_10130 [Anaerolinea sp.]|nr:hypothetical protein [Anaerolinea sp.]
MTARTIRPDADKMETGEEDLMLDIEGYSPLPVSLLRQGSVTQYSPSFTSPKTFIPHQEVKCDQELCQSADLVHLRQEAGQDRHPHRRA